MSGAGNKTEKKQAYLDKLKYYMDHYSKIIVVGADNVGSTQMHQIRQSLRGKAEILMGKNTMMKKAMREYMECNPKIEPLFGLVKNNVGFVFTDGDVDEIMQELVKHKVGAPAKVGTVAPNDVVVPKGLTGLEPTQTQFLHILNIPSKITKGQIEILNDVQIITAGEKVNPSQAAFLQRLNIKPFSYCLSLQHLYLDGAIGNATQSALPQALSNAYNNVLAVALQTEYSLPFAEKIKAYLETAAFALPPTPCNYDPPADEIEVNRDSDSDVGDVGDIFGGGLFGDD